MDRHQPLPVKKAKGPQLLLSHDTIATILWESAWTALIRTFIVQILGSIAAGFISDVFREMSPAAPPGFGHHHLALPTSRVWHGVGTFVGENQFWVIFAVLFFIIAATRLAHFLRNPKHRKLVAWFLWIHRRISCHWFSLFVINGFTAWIYATIIVAVQQFSWAHILWSAISGIVQPVIQMLGSLLPGAGFIGSWFSWYGENQPKFLFWLLYSAAICDDLGLPNYKALIRWSGRRLSRYFQSRWGARGTEQSKPFVRDLEKTEGATNPAMTAGCHAEGRLCRFVDRNR